MAAAFRRQQNSSVDAIDSHGSQYFRGSVPGAISAFRTRNEPLVLIDEALWTEREFSRTTVAQGRIAFSSHDLGRFSGHRLHSVLVNA